MVDSGVAILIYALFPGKEVVAKVPAPRYTFLRSVFTGN